MKRANRLSRSRDFDAVHRRGRSVSSRFLVLYWLPQEEPSEPRIGFAVPRAVESLRCPWSWFRVPRERR